MEECAVSNLTDNVKGIKNDFDKARKNMDFMDK